MFQLIDLLIGIVELVWRGSRAARWEVDEGRLRSEVAAAQRRLDAHGPRDARVTRPNDRSRS
jgi:hypothetical protein